MVTQERLYTIDGLWEISYQPEYADKHLELVEGYSSKCHRPAASHSGSIQLDFTSNLNDNGKAIAETS